MTDQEQICNWLSSAFKNGPQGFSEFFYYDKRDHTFFSILLVDYFIFDENFTVPNNVTVSYSAENITILADKMKRIACEDQSILPIPLADPETELENQIDTFLNLNAINIDTAVIWLPEDGSITIPVDKNKPLDTDNKEMTVSARKPWWRFW